MGRERNRIAKQREKNAVVECNKIQKKYYPELFTRFAEVLDPRNGSYIDYSIKEMLGTVYYKGIAGISSMQEMTRTFTDEAVTRNIYSFLGTESKEYVPHGVTINETLERLDPVELEKIQKDIAYTMIRRKTFDSAKVEGRWLVLVDGTELDEGKQKKNEYYLSRTYNRGEDNEFVKYHRSVLEAKLYLGKNLVCSIATEPIENTDEYNRKQMTEEAIKQDCESKAFIRLSKKLKKAFPRLPICIVADGLYVSSKVMGICRKNSWDFIIRYKEGCASTIEREFIETPEKEVHDRVEYANEIVYQYNESSVNVLRYKEKRVKAGKEIETTYTWITSIEITKRNAKKLVRAGRNRWKIENQGFNRQKHWQEI